MIGIFGGTFNPIHNGHLKAAEQVLARLSLDSIHFLPCAIPVHRKAPLINGLDRLNIICLSISGQTRFSANSLELDRGGPSYMVDTLLQLKKIYPQQALCLILGTDAFNRIKSWKSSDQLLKLAHLVICQRPDIKLNRNIFEGHWTDSVENLKPAKTGYILPLEIEECDCSSTAVRAMLKNKTWPKDCLSETAFEYIVNNHLYEK